MYWFLYDIGLRHERVKIMICKIFDKNNKNIGPLIKKMSQKKKLAK